MRIVYNFLPDKSNVEGEYWEVEVFSNKVTISFSPDSKYNTDFDQKDRVYVLPAIAEEVEFHDEYITIQCDDNKTYVFKIESMGRLIGDIFDEHEELYDTFANWDFYND